MVSFTFTFNFFPPKESLSMYQGATITVFVPVVISHVMTLLLLLRSLLNCSSSKAKQAKQWEWIWKRKEKPVLLLRTIKDFYIFIIIIIIIIVIIIIIIIINIIIYININIIIAIIILVLFVKIVKILLQVSDINATRNCTNTRRFRNNPWIRIVYFKITNGSLRFGWLVIDNSACF